MPFEKVETQVDFPAREREILEFWDRIQAFTQLREKNKGKPPWSFLDGPITANNPMGVHHAWGRTYKDAYQRYFAMTGHELRYQNGFDCQGLWVEVEVEKEFKLQSKRDIETLVPGDREKSIDKFVSECKKRVDHFARVQTEQSIRLGYWMDWDRTDEDWAKPPGQRKSYFTMAEENNYTIWSFLKKCHERKLIYKGFDAMPWCPRCGVGISQMEMHEGYKITEHKSVFVKFPLKDRPGENLLVWTTTPWTLPANVGAAVNPELTYLKVRLRDEHYYVAKGAWTKKRLEEQFKDKSQWISGVPKLKTLEQIFKEKAGKEGFEIVAEIKGSDMLGWKYQGPFDEVAEAQQQPYGYPDELAEVVNQQGWAPKVAAREAHRIIAWKDVGETEGTGIVHIAPGCGKEDFGLGKEQGLPPIAPLNEAGEFLDGFDQLAGLSAVGSDVTAKVFSILEDQGRFFADERYVHKYPHCWRCKTELLYRLVDEWYIDMQWRDEIQAIVDQVTFLPESINGKAREHDWLMNMGDWMISKKRFWGLALPIWECESCGHFDVIGSREELDERASEGLEALEGKTPHRPWIDKVKLKCPECSGVMSRIPDVGNPWLDAGIVPYSTMGYNDDRDYWEKWFPAQFITESFPGQFRNWFYAILAMSTMMENRPPFEVLLGHALVRDQYGRPMHKSDGNSIAFEEAADETFVIVNDKGVRESHGAMGADVIRWLYCRHNPAANINFGPKPADDVRARFILKVWNSYAFLCNYARLDGFDPTANPVEVSTRPDIDQWILSDLQALIQTANQSFQNFDVMSFCLEAERFVDDKLSNWYIRRNRGRFWAKNDAGDVINKLAAYQTLYTVMTTFTQLIAPVVPFLSEMMWQNLRTDQDVRSIHLCDYPVPEASLQNEALSADMNALLRLVSLGSAARNVAKIKVRQPLAALTVQPANESERRAVEMFTAQIREELNVKQVVVHEPTASPLLRSEVNFNMKSAGPKLASSVKDAQKVLAEMEPAALRKQLASDGTIDLALPSGPVTLSVSDFHFSDLGEEGWVGIADGGTQVALDARMTPELIQEGMARDVIRHVQSLRKEANLEMNDVIDLYLETDAEELRTALENHRDYVARETQVACWVDAPITGAPTASVKVDGKALSISLRRANERA